MSLADANLRFLQRQRARLRERTVQIADNERRRVAGDLHDGVVLDLVGASYVVGAAIAPVHATGGADLAEALRGAVGGIRTSIQGLRSMIMEISPASLRGAGLRAALSDLVAAVQAADTRVREGAVKAHLGSAFQRIGVSGRTSAALWARSDLPSAAG